jgi:hypothetical protein
MCEGQNDGVRYSQGEIPLDMAEKQAVVRKLDEQSGIAGIPVTDSVAKALEEGKLPK